MIFFFFCYELHIFFRLNCAMPHFFAWSHIRPPIPNKERGSQELKKSFNGSNESHARERGGSQF